MDSTGGFVGGILERGILERWTGGGGFGHSHFPLGSRWKSSLAPCFEEMTCECGVPVVWCLHVIGGFIEKVKDGGGGAFLPFLWNTYTCYTITVFRNSTKKTVINVYA